MSLLVPGAAFCGFLVQQAIMIAPAVKKDEDTPNQFSLRYYFSRPYNRLQLFMNGVATIGLMLAHSEIVGLMVKIPYVGPYLEGTTTPILTGLLIGFGAAWVFRWLASKMT